MVRWFTPDEAAQVKTVVDPPRLQIKDSAAYERDLVFWVAFKGDKFPGITAQQIAGRAKKVKYGESVDHSSASDPEQVVKNDAHKAKVNAFARTKALTAAAEKRELARLACAGNGVLYQSVESMKGIVAKALNEHPALLQVKE